jgi:hypothetical protein
MPDAPDKKDWRQIIREFMFGMTGYEFAIHAVQLRSQVETLFMLMTVGDMIGIPIMPPYYSLRLLPYVVPQVNSWKRRVLREKDVTEDEEYDLHGV